MRAGANSEFRVRIQEFRSSGKKTSASPTRSLSASVPIIPLCGLRDLCAMLSPGASFRHRNSGVSPARIHSQPPSQSFHSPSVASVTSVRCFPLASRSRTETVASPDTASLTASVPIIPLCGLRDLCAMLSLASRSRTEAVASPDTASLTASVPIIPLCGLRDLCAMLSLASRSRTEKWRLPRLPQPRPNHPLCGLRDLCAMLSLASVLAPKESPGAPSPPIIPPLWPPPQWECRGISAPLLPTRKSKSTPWSAWRT